MKLFVVLLTAPDREVAENLANALVEERLAACVNLVGGVTSIYRWEGSTVRAEEVVLIAKTGEDRVEALIARVAELHPYDVPEALALPVTHGHRPYIEWAEDASRPGPTEAP